MYTSDRPRPRRGNGGLLARVQGEPGAGSGRDLTRAGGQPRGRKAVMTDTATDASRTHEELARRRFGEFLGGLWATACEALAVPAEQAARTTRELRELLPAWADERIGAAPRRPSFVAADGFPAELSVNWSGGRPELRVLFDCLSDPSGGWSVLTRASSRFGQVSELFAGAPLW